MRFAVRRLAVLAGTIVLFCPALFAAEGKLSGTVVDESGQPVAGAAVVVTTPSLATLNLALTSDDAGRWEAEVPNASWTYSIRGEKEGYSPRMTQIQPLPGKDTNVFLT